MAAGRRQTAAAVRSAEADADTTARPAKRMKGQIGTTQADCTVTYAAIPEGTYVECSDARYQSNHEPKPYAHIPRTLLQEQGRCMVCWSPDHIMWKCPERSAAVKAEQEKKHFVSSAALNTKLKEPVLQMCELTCLEDSADKSEYCCESAGPMAMAE